MGMTDVNADFGTWPEDALAEAGQYWLTFIDETGGLDDKDSLITLAVGVAGVCEEYDIAVEDASQFMAAAWLYTDGALRAANEIVDRFEPILDE